MEIYHRDPAAREYLSWLFRMLSVDSIQLLNSLGIAALPKLMSFHTWSISSG